MNKRRFAVSIEACHILTRERAEEVAELIRDRMLDIDEDVYVCVSDYRAVQSRVAPREDDQFQQLAKIG